MTSHHLNSKYGGFKIKTVADVASHFNSTLGGHCGIYIALIQI